jgi:hypothetical protein
VATFTFDYQFREGRKLPICSVDLIGPAPGGRTTIRALVDTGAAYSIFLRSEAERVGMSLPALPNQRLTFGSGEGLGRRVRSTLELGGERFTAEVVYIDDVDWPLRYPLLGRVGVFPRYRHVAFRERLATPIIEFQT